MRTNVTFADLVAIARRVGVKVVEAPSSHRGKLGTMGTVRGLTLHHTGTANTFKPTVDYPDFNVVKEGRPGLENSLSAWGVGRFEAIYVFSEFLSWHAGVWNWKGITDGNGDFLGIEAAGVGDWTEFQRKVYPRLVASALLFLGEGIDMAPRHLDGAMPRGRKSDAANFDGNFYQGKTFYQWVEFFLANPAHININFNTEDDMPTLDEIRDAVWHAPFDSILDGVKGRQAWEIYRGLEKNAHNAAVQATAAAKQVASLSGAVSGLTKLVAEQNGLTIEDVERVVNAAVEAGVKVSLTIDGPDPA